MSADHNPFPRMVDFVVCGAGGRGAAGGPVGWATRGPTFKFNDGAVFDRDSWRVQTVMLVAVSVDGEVEVVGNSRRMMAIANGLAAAGVPTIVELIRDGEQDAIWNLSDGVEGIIHG